MRYSILYITYYISYALYIIYYIYIIFIYVGIPMLRAAVKHTCYWRACEMMTTSVKSMTML